MAKVDDAVLPPSSRAILPIKQITVISVAINGQLQKIIPTEETRDTPGCETKPCTGNNILIPSPACFK